MIAQALWFVALLVGFFLFGCGLFAVSQLQVCRNVFQSYSELVEAPVQEDVRGIHFLLALILFCGICNAALLLPGLLQMIGALSGLQSLLLHRVILGLLFFLVLVVCAIGLLAILGLSRSARQFLDGVFPGKMLMYSLSKNLDQTSLFCLSVALASYFLSVSRGDFAYDTGLYHFPFVQHVIQFGLEPGLANLHMRYAFYNLQFFGQVPLQFFAVRSGLVSPSLNILFFAGFLLFAYDSLASSFRNREAALPSRLLPLSVIAFWLIALKLGLGNQPSLVSYDADFAVALLASILVFACYRTASFSGLKREYLVLAFCLPLLKFSGAVVLVFVLLFAAFRFGVDLLLERASAGLQARSLRLRALSGLGFLRAGRRWLLSLLAAMYALFLATNLLLSGYAVFPQPQTGPVGQHAVPLASVVALKEEGITAWARATTGGSAPKVTAATPLRDWLPPFLRSRRGMRISFWILSSILISLVCLAALGLKRKVQDFAVLLAFASATAVMSLLVLLILPPDPRFYAWLDGFAFFGCVQLLILAPLVGTSIFLALLTLLSVVRPGRIARFRTPAVSSFAYPTSPQAAPLWSSRVRGADGSVQIHRPSSGDQCWDAAPPCTPDLRP